MVLQFGWVVRCCILCALARLRESRTSLSSALFPTSAFALGIFARFRCWTFSNSTVSSRQGGARRRLPSSSRWLLLHLFLLRLACICYDVSIDVTSSMTSLHGPFHAPLATPRVSVVALLSSCTSLNPTDSTTSQVGSAGVSEGSLLISGPLQWTSSTSSDLEDRDRPPRAVLSSRAAEASWTS